MKSSIRQGDFKLYQHAQAGSYELYRLSKDGARQDIEENINLINDPEYAELVKGLTVPTQCRSQGPQRARPLSEPHLQRQHPARCHHHQLFPLRPASEPQH